MLIQIVSGSSDDGGIGDDYLAVVDRLHRVS
jgi:hypothetical protein